MKQKLFSIFCCLLLSASMVTHAGSWSWNWTDVSASHNIQESTGAGYQLWQYRWYNPNTNPCIKLYFINKVDEMADYNGIHCPPIGNYQIQSDNAANTVANGDFYFNGYKNSLIVNASGTTYLFYSGNVYVAEGADGPYIYSTNLRLRNSSYTSTYSGFNSFYIGSQAVYQTVTVQSESDTKGTVNYVKKSGYVYPIDGTQVKHWKNGSTYTLTATHKENYRFVSWKKGNKVIAEYPDNVIDVIIDGDATYTATFEQESGNQYTINTAVNNPALGSITAGGKKSENTNFTIIATANDPNEYYVEDWLKNDTSMGVMKNSLVVPVTAAEDNNTYTAVFAQRTKKTLFCDDDMTFSGNGPYTFSGTATDAQNNVYNISLSTTNVSQGNFSVQEKTNAINSITSKSGTVTTSQLSNTYYAVNAVVIGSDEIRYDISGGFQQITSSFRSFSYNYSQDHILTEIEDVSEDWNPANKKFVTVTAYNMDNIDNATYNYLKLRFNTENLNYTYANNQIGPAPGTYPTIPLGWWSEGVGYCDYTEGIMSYRSDLRWLSSYVGDYQSAAFVGTYDVKVYNNMGSVVAEVSEGKDGKMFIMVKYGEQVWFTIGEPAVPPTLVLGETTNGTFSATDGTKNYTAGRYKMPIGAQLSLTATPAEGYVVAKWLLNGEEVGDELGNLMKATELTYTVASEDVVDDKITIVPVFGEKSDCTMAFDDIAVELNEQEHSARLVAANSVGGVAVLDFIGLTSFDEQIGVSAGTYTIGTDLVVGNAVAQTGSYVTDGSSTWNLASGTITIAKANGKMTLTTSSVKSTDPQDVTLTATDITCSVIRRITYVINDALYSDNNDGRFRFIGTIGNKEINICFYGNELNPVGTYTNDEIYDGDSPNNYVTIADVKCYNVQYATVTKDGNHYILDAEFDNPNGGYYHVIMKALVPKSGDTMEDYLVTRNNPSTYVTFAESDITVTQQAEGYQYLHAKTGGDNYMEAKMYFYTGSAEGGIPTGTYTISDSQQPGTVRMINSTAYRSYTQTNWYIARGTVTVVHQNNHYYIVVRAFNTRYKATDNRQYTVNFTIGTELAATPEITLNEDGSQHLDNGVATSADLSSKYAGRDVNVTLNRQLYGGSWNTICFPFSVEDLDVKGNELYDILRNSLYELQPSTTTATADGMIINFLPLSYEEGVMPLKAGVPYLIRTSTDIDLADYKFENVRLDYTIHSILKKEDVDLDVQFIPVMTRTLLTSKKDIVVVGSRLYYPNQSGGSYLRAFRAYLHITNGMESNYVQPRIRIVDTGETITLDEDQAEIETRKYVEDGILIIERGGVRYDAQGKRME